MFGFVKKATTSMHFIGWCMGKFHNETKSGEGGPAHPDDTLRGVLQLGWRTGSPWLLDHCDE